MHASSGSPAGRAAGPGQGTPGSWLDQRPSALDGSRGGAPRGRGAGVGIALLSALAFGGSGVAAKPLITAGLEPLHVTWLRVAGAALVMLPVAWRHRDLPRRQPALLAGYGLLAVAGVQACYFAALSRIPVGVALLIEYLAPALVLGWVRFVQKRPVTRAAALGVVLAVGGLACVVEIWSGLSFDVLGLALALGAACCQVGYFVLSDHGSDGEDRADPLGVIAYGLLIGAVVLTAIARPWELDWTVLGGAADMNGTEVPAALLLAWIVLVATVAAYLTGVVSIRRLSPQVAGVVACLEAVIATVLAWVLLGEHLSAPQILGGVVVLIGAFIAQLAKPQTTESLVVAGAGPGETTGSVQATGTGARGDAYPSGGDAAAAAAGAPTGAGDGVPPGSPAA
ncbi:membrane protein [Streptomyces nigrescens]|uniref:Membrane protein n=2 Tax=Streptomyces TaxID=1883 RepID=A0ABN6QUG8_STRNI|nr:EamA family transporter [Streptomyces nigrescens]MEE4418726.1 EamA family transporter [Streptomyces sp. DSM 41528]BDM68910.1 membrane protein [Streptomyces nigrescens]